ncbi:hypothetical protein FFJ24_010695 [Pedobacter sp. KBS0701]|uniref:hypothetical protein n=1 Tax=Pedobacter sp. KBS0701 TaxID=2578106 RepID=UPI00110D725F|nr:hypothetical protein [Pedobacter sp. KBS0701]QDW25251.1 hypothetical protein FFJ24_010695 [Pedobacter sp. KBS0701]
MPPSKKPNISALAFKFLQEKDPYTFLASLRNTIPASQYGVFVDEILKRPALLEKIAIFREHPAYTDLQESRTLPPIDPYKELSWMKAFLIRSVSRLQNFIIYSENFSKEFISGKFTEASTTLEKIENEYGCSIWLIKNKMALIQFSQGLQAQKAYADLIKNNIEHTGIIAYLTYWISLRNEDSVTASRYEQQFEQNFRQWGEKTKNDLGIYIRFHLLADESGSPQEAIDLPRIDQSRSLIDFYESFIYLCRSCAVSNSELKSSILFIIKALQEKMKDQRLDFLSALIANEYKDTCESDIAFEVYDLYIQGNIEKANALAKEGIELTPGDPYLIFLLAFTDALLSDSKLHELGIADVPEPNQDTLHPGSISPGAMIQKALFDLFTKGLGNQATQNTIEKSFDNFASFPWAGVFPMAAFFVAPDKISQSLTLGHQIKYGHAHPLLIKVAQNSELLSSSLEGFLSSKKDIGLRFASYPDSLDNTKVIAEEIYLKKGTDSYLLGETDSAITYAEYLTVSQYSHFRRLGMQMMSNSLLKAGRISEVCCYISKKYVLDDSIADLFPLAELAKILDPKLKEWKMVNDKISLSIVIDMILKYSADTEESYRAFAYEDFLLLNGHERPSQLEYDGSSEMIYYLRYICIQSIMDISTEFDTPEDVEKERLAVLRKLLVIDIDNSEEYELEIKKIVRKQVIRQKMLEMEQNKIYVDLEKFRNWANKEIRENFLRYQVYLKNGLGLDAQKQSHEAKAKAYDDDPTALLTMAVPINEPFSLLRSILIEILEGYSSSSEFGLDRYLSTRLRHGAIENQLRKFMSKNHLITKKESKNGVYKKNFHWLEKLGADLYNSRDLDPIFRKFSEKYDKLIETIIYEWIVINKGNNDKALFMPPLRDGEVALIQSKLSPNTSFTQFMDIVISYMEERLTGALFLVRDKLNNDAKPEVIKMLNNLQNQVARGGVISDLDNAIHTCRTQVQPVFERISDWFTPASSFENTEFPLEDAISVAEAIVQDTTPNFSVKYTIVTQRPDPIKINKLPIFFDIMTNAFENVVKRSGLEIPHVDIEISVKQEEDEELLSLFLRNELGADVNLQNLEKILEAKRQKIAENNYHSEITKENGTGLFKILQSLKDLNQSPNYQVSIDFGIIDRIYFLNLTLPPVKKTTDPQ